jgi:nifR3 family TIM-barrel protein
MFMNFWNDIKKPFFTLAPMEDVTDTVFRQIVMELSEPDMLHVLFTEFTSTDGLCHEVGRARVIDRLIVSESERALLRKYGIKIVAQIWGANPEKYYKSIKYICSEMDFDGIDINMGCPIKKIIKSGSCSALINQPDLAKEIISASKEATDLPVSVKTRTGVKNHETERWMEQLIEAEPAAIILHVRTQKMMTELPAEWGEMTKAVAVRDASGKNIPILGNGDIFSMNDAQEKLDKYKMDGVMIGRGIFHDPWFFRRMPVEPSREEKLAVLLRHTMLYEDTWGKGRQFAVLKRFFKIYTSGFPGAAELRARLMETKNYEEVSHLLNQFTTG